MLNQFSLYIKNKNLSDNTQDAYLRDVSKFIKYSESKKADITANVNAGYIGNYFKWLNESGISATTVNRTVSSLRCFFDFLKENNYVKTNPIKKITTQKNKNQVVEYLTRDEIVKFLTISKGDTPKSKRDRAILDILFACGVKTSELIDLKATCLNRQLGIISIKSDIKERIVPIYSEALIHLIDYIDNVREKIIKDDTELLFTNMSGKKLTRQGVWKIVNTYAEKTDIEKNITPNIIRNSLAIQLIENGTDLKYIKDILGYTDISSVRTLKRMREINTLM